MKVQKASLSFVVAFFLLCVTPAFASPGKDKRLTPISEAEVRKAARNLPPASPQHPIILSRADSSGLERLAYQEYLRVLNENPENFHANLNCGIAAKLYLGALIHPFNRKGRPFSSEESKLYAELLKRAGTCLEKAIKLNPKSGIAHTEYGIFLCYEGGRPEEGLRLLQRGVQLEEKNPRTHRLLGNVLSMPGTKRYDPKRAEAELRKAIELDAAYAAPHMTLAILYTYQRRFQEADRELSEYVRLAPESAAKSESVTSLREELRKHLN